MKRFDDCRFLRPPLENYGLIAAFSGDNKAVKPNLEKISRYLLPLDDGIRVTCVV